MAQQKAKSKSEVTQCGYLNSCLFCSFLFMLPVTFLLSTTSICTNTTQNSLLHNQFHQTLISTFSTNFHLHLLRNSNNNMCGSCETNTESLGQSRIYHDSTATARQHNVINRSSMLASCLITSCRWLTPSTTCHGGGSDDMRSQDRALHYRASRGKKHLTECGELDCGKYCDPLIMRVVTLLEAVYQDTMSAVRADGGLSEYFAIVAGVTQGCY